MSPESLPCAKALRSETACQWPATIPSTSPTMTRSGACPSGMTGRSSRSSSSMVSRPGSPGSPSSASGSGIERSTTASTRSGSPAGRRRAWRSSWPIQASSGQSEDRREHRERPGLPRLRESDVRLGHFLWDFIGGQPRVNRWPSTGRIPAETEESRAMSKALKPRVTLRGPTICYANHAGGGHGERHSSPAPSPRGWWSKLAGLALRLVTETPSSSCWVRESGRRRVLREPPDEQTYPLRDNADALEPRRSQHNAPSRAVDPAALARSSLVGRVGSPPRAD